MYVSRERFVLEGQVIAQRFGVFEHLRAGSDDTCAVLILEMVSPGG